MTFLVMAMGAVVAFVLLGIVLGRSPRRTAQRGVHGYATSGDSPVMFFDGGSGGSDGDCGAGDGGCGDGGGAGCDGGGGGD